MIPGDHPRQTLVAAAAGAMVTAQLLIDAVQGWPW